MTRTLNARLRRLWLDVHLWIGVGLLAALIPLSVTGSALVWHDALDRMLYADRYAVSGPEARLSPADYARAAEAAFAGKARLTQVRLPQEPGDPVVAVGRLDGPAGPGGRPRTLNAWIDPPTGKVLATGETAKSVTQVLHRLHGSLMIPQIGRKVVGWLGWAMFVSCVTGLWLWWPRHGGFTKGLRWRRGPSTLFNLHHMVGFWVCIPLAVLSLTGVYISFPQTSRALFGVAQPQRPGGPGGGGPGRFAPPVPQTQTSLEQAVAVAAASKPGAQVVSVSVPTRGQEPAWRVQLKTPGAKQPATVQVVDATGQVKAARGPGGEGGPDPLSRWMRKIHDGADTGIVWQTIIFLGGIAPALLGVTGVIMWLRRRGRRVAQTRRLAEA
ncbi:PepSY-associated TM helix domain-containing protein [Phenylobacterium sp.]|uniref:PepSY-associated TM helix domain-containing protein n=1 Tax=Phenylobacterium sp. TaxID=1871053 RepID=UPI002CC712ED|nr:PepSY-associated TM helix domain-containing protein [Phenylobacterium sp.]HVI31195.1 PepSY-associated TM helix domain-containing protein [Phenylobacterium sp.]